MPHSMNPSAQQWFGYKKRDLNSILLKTRYVLFPFSSEEKVRELRDWDLFGPLVIGVTLTALSQKTDGSQNKRGQSQRIGRCQLSSDDVWLGTGHFECQTDWSPTLFLLLRVRSRFDKKVILWLQ